MALLSNKIQIIKQSFHSQEESDDFPKEQSVMLNFQIENIDRWMEHFNKIGVPLIKGPEKSEYGTFLWISDPEGRWIEIWEK